MLRLHRISRVDPVQVLPELELEPLAPPELVPPERVLPELVPPVEMMMTMLLMPTLKR